MTAIAVEAALVHSIRTIIGTITLDRIGQLAVMDLLDIEREQLDLETLKQVRARAKLYDGASEFGRGVALGAGHDRVGGGVWADGR